MYGGLLEQYLGAQVRCGGVRDVEMFEHEGSSSHEKGIWIFILG